ncbi:MAG: hypothetical protein ACK5LN_04810, partial [Propioniciclava sp.]
TTPGGSSTPGATTPGAGTEVVTGQTTSPAPTPTATSGCWWVCRAGGVVNVSSTGNAGTSGWNWNLGDIKKLGLTVNFGVKKNLGWNWNSGIKKNVGVKWNSGAKKNTKGWSKGFTVCCKR